jgi:phosphoribosylformylglycinamidine cyclo-ligase
LGGETAELPGFYARGEYDLAGFGVGIVERSKILDGRTVVPGDALVGIASSGLHSNGYSLARKVLLEQHQLRLDMRPPGFHRQLDDELLEPTRLYTREVAALLDAVQLKALAHVTGGGIPGNLPRVLPAGTRAVVEESRWTRPPVFDLIASLGPVERDEMFATFNMGLGMIAVMATVEVPAALRALARAGAKAWEVGWIEQGEGEPAAVVVP